MRRYLIIVFFAILTSNIIFLDIFFLKNLNKKEAPRVTPKCDFSCPASCLKTITEATSSFKLVEQSKDESVSEAPKTVITQIVAPTSTNLPLKEYFVNFGGSVWTSSDWQNVPDLVKSVNPASFGNVKNIYFEVVAHLANENTSGSVRLYNATDKQTVSNSEVIFSSMKCQEMISLPINLGNGNKSYQVQMKGSPGETFNIDEARLRIVTQ